MKYLTVVIVLFAILGIIVSAWLNKRSRDSSLSVYSHHYRPDTKILEQRYLQFSGTPGVLLYGFRLEEQRGVYTAMSEPWGVSMKPYPFFPHAIEKEKERKQEGNGLNMRAGFCIQEHGKVESGWYARYVYVSCLWIIFYLSVLLVLTLGLLTFIKIKRKN